MLVSVVRKHLLRRRLVKGDLVPLDKLARKKVLKGDILLGLGNEHGVTRYAECSRTVAADGDR